MKRVEVDCNFNWLGPHCPSLSVREVDSYKLTEGEELIVYQDDDEWLGRVFFDPELPDQYQWYIGILPD